jgi:uncharacterized protein (TIGR03083 family)
MTTPAYSELVTAVRREGEGILTAAGMGLDADVPTCEEWDVASLVDHVSRLYSRIGFYLSHRITERPESVPELPEGKPLDVLSGRLDELVLALAECEPDTPVWNWVFDGSGTAAFWARRMAHESSVHRYDAQASHGVVQPIDSELAGDGIDEFIDVIAPRIYGREGASGPTGSVAMSSSDDGSWLLALEPNGISRLDVLSEPDVTVHATSSALLLATCGRVPWTSLAVTGDTDLLTRWTASLAY